MEDEDEIKRHSNRFLNVLIILLLLVFLGTAGKLGWNYYQQHYQRIEPEKLITVKSNTKNSEKQNQVTELTAERKEIIKMVMRDATGGKFKKQGFVAVPKLGILLPIYNDAYSEAGLNVGADYANFDIVPKMGEKNYALAAHNFNNGVNGFSAMQNGHTDDPYVINGESQDKVGVRNGIKVYMMDVTNIYEYTIYNQHAVHPNQVSVIDNDLLGPNKKPKLTIVSCLFPDYEEWRIITDAELTKTWTNANAPEEIINYFNLKIQKTNARASWFNPGVEEGANGDAGGTKSK
jgi:sortase A